MWFDFEFRKLEVAVCGRVLLFDLLDPGIVVWSEYLELRLFLGVGARVLLLFCVVLSLLASTSSSYASDKRMRLLDLRGVLVRGVDVGRL